MTFKFDVSYPESASVAKAFRHDDMDYLRSRIMTHRSVHGGELTLVDGHYYEAAKTLVDIVEYILSNPRGTTVRRAEVCIDTDDTVFPKSRIYASAVLRWSNTESIPFEIEAIYTDVTGKSGGFIIGMSVETRTGIITRTLGTEPIGEVMGQLPRDLPGIYAEDLCVPAGEVLKFSENFPTPSVFVSMSDTLIKKLRNDIKSSMKGVY